MRFEVKSVNPVEQKTDVAIVAVFENGELGSSARALNKASNGLIADALANGDINPKTGATLLLPTSDLACKRILLVGCGKRASFDRKQFRKAVTRAFSAVKARPYKSLAVYLCLEKVRKADA